MNAPATAADPSQDDVRLIPVSALVPDDANVRPDANGDPALRDADDQLAASIAALGLLENLVVVARDDGRFGVAGGGRRLRALNRLVADERIGADHAVPCKVVPREDAAESSLAENTVRVGMHPADQVRAYARLVAEGATAAQIAARFGVSERTVAKRLRLGALPAVILDAYRDGRINTETAEAFATTADAGFQETLFEQLERGNMLYARSVRYAIGERHTRSDSPLALFVGIEDYMAAGGRTEDPLFIEDRDREHITLLDPDVLVAVATERLEAAAAEHADDWKWTAAALEHTWADQQLYTVASPFRRGRPTDEEQAAFDESNGILEELDRELNFEAPDDDRVPEIHRLVAEHTAKAAAIDAAVEARSEYSKNVRAHGGVLATVSGDGRLEIRRGLIRREDQAAYHAAVHREPDPADGPDGTSRGDDGTTGDDGGAAPAPRYTDALRRDLRVMRTAAFRQALARDPGAAADILAFTLARKLRLGGISEIGYESAALRFNLEYEANHVSDGLRASPVMDALHPVPDDVDLSWVADKDTAAGFRTFRALPGHHRAAVLAACVANLTFHALGDDKDAPGAHEQLVRDLDVDFPAELERAGALPFDKDLVWMRMNKALILGAGADALGGEWADKHRSFKKRDLAEAAANAFRPDPSRDDEADRAAAGWLPPGFRPLAADAQRATDGDAAQGTGPAADGSPGMAAESVAGTAPDAPAPNEASIDDASNAAAPASEAKAGATAPGGLPAFLDD